MMRLPLFEFRAPHTLEEAAHILDSERANAMPLAGGTDLLPNMKRRQQVPRILMSLRYIEDLTRIQFDHSPMRQGRVVADVADGVAHQHRDFQGSEILFEHSFEFLLIVGPFVGEAADHHAGDGVENSREAELR